jgi:NADH:ubiquinone oxidoreductase subunit 6 (subunit J)
VALLLRFFGAEFISLIILIIYVGVFAVLFLFSLIIYKEEIIIPVKPLFFKQSKVSSAVSILLFSVILGLLILLIAIVADFLGQYIGPAFLMETISETLYFEALFNDYWFLLIILAVLLFVVMIGAITITRYTSYLKFKCC